MENFESIALAITMLTWIIYICGVMWWFGYQAKQDRSAIEARSKENFNLCLDMYRDLNVQIERSHRTLEKSIKDFMENSKKQQ